MQLKERLVSQVEKKLNEENDYIGAEIKLRQQKLDAEKYYKYIALAFYIVVGMILASITISLKNKLGSAKYTRSSLEEVMKEKLGAYKISEAFTDELLITAYDYNS